MGGLKLRRPATDPTLSPLLRRPVQFTASFKALPGRNLGTLGRDAAGAWAATSAEEAGCEGREGPGERSVAIVGAAKALAQASPVIEAMKLKRTRVSAIRKRLQHRTEGASCPARDPLVLTLD